MQTIGLIGGMSWESSAVYYKIVNEKVKAHLGGVHSCQCLMYSVDFGEWALKKVFVLRKICKNALKY